MKWSELHGIEHVRHKIQKCNFCRRTYYYNIMMAWHVYSVDHCIHAKRSRDTQHTREYNMFFFFLGISVTDRHWLFKCNLIYLFSLCVLVSFHFSAFKHSFRLIKLFHVYNTHNITIPSLCFIPQHIGIIPMAWYVPTN